VTAYGRIGVWAVSALFLAAKPRFKIAPGVYRRLYDLQFNVQAGELAGVACDEVLVGVAGVWASRPKGMIGVGERAKGHDRRLGEWAKGASRLRFQRRSRASR
jgi:hypothetical protein